MSARHDHGAAEMRFLGIDLDLLMPADRRDLANTLARAAWSAALAYMRILLVELLIKADDGALEGRAT